MYREFCIDKLKYIIKYPNNFNESKEYPVILFLHGAGSRGSQMQGLLDNPFFKKVGEFEEFPFLIVAPLCSENTWYDHWQNLESLVRTLHNISYVDSERVYMMGASMGGYATWQLAMSMPDYFAAIVPICGGGMYWNAGRLVNIPIWAFHGEQDTTVFLEESAKMVDAVNRRGGNAKFTVYPHNGHDAWSDTYSNWEVYEWMLRHRKNTSKELLNIFSNPNIYG